MSTCSSSENRITEAPVSDSGGETSNARTDYLLSDIAPQSPPMDRGDGRIQHGPTSDNTPRASAPASDLCRITLAPLPPPLMTPDMTLFHRALAAWNAAHYRTATWDDLTTDEQRQVRELVAMLEREAHPCR